MKEVYCNFLFRSDASAVVETFKSAVRITGAGRCVVPENSLRAGCHAKTTRDIGDFAIDFAHALPKINPTQCKPKAQGRICFILPSVFLFFLVFSRFLCLSLSGDLMPTVHAFHVVPALPDSLDRLRGLAFNIQWAWNHEAIELFRRLDRDLWEASGHNPVRMLGAISQERLREVAQDDSFLAELDRACFSLENYMRATTTWFTRNWEGKVPPQTRIAYFSMEFGLTECLPIYSGGLGVLAGDHLKSSSDLGIPLGGYRTGSTSRATSASRSTADGWQQERYPDNDFYNMPMQLQTRRERQSAARLRGFSWPRRVIAQVWKVQVGRIPLYLLDTNIDDNNYDDQNITDQLYGGDSEMRLKQEIILGIGGMRALAALGIEPTLCHMNEGHSGVYGLRAHTDADAKDTTATTGTPARRPQPAACSPRIRPFPPASICFPPTCWAATSGLIRRAVGTWHVRRVYEPGPLPRLQYGRKVQHGDHGPASTRTMSTA